MCSSDLTYYYVVNAAGYPSTSFQLSATVGGTAIIPTASATATMYYQRWASTEPDYGINFGTNLYSKSSTVLSTSSTNRLNNGQLYIESPIIGSKRYDIMDFPYTDSLAERRLINYNLINLSAMDTTVKNTVFSTAKSTLNIEDRKSTRLNSSH